MATGNQALNEFAIYVSVSGEEQLAKLGDQLKALKTHADELTKKLGGKPTQAIKNAENQVEGNNKVLSSSEKRRIQVERDQAKERQSMRATNARIRAQSLRYEKYNRKVVAASRLTKNEITDMFRRVALWSTGIGVLFGTLSKVKFIFGAVKDLEVQMVELKKVMDDDTPFRTARRALFETALSMSVSVGQAAEIAKIWAQQGYELNEVATLTKTALLGVNSANLTAQQSVEFLTSAMRSFNLEAHETAQAIDSIMAIQADFAITSQSLAKGMQVAGAITAQLGGDMNELFGMMTAIGQVTRETGNVIGNSLKTQLARLQQPRTIKYLEQLGVATRRLTDEGVVRRLSAFDIFKQIAKLRTEGTLTQDQVLDIALKIGGVRKFKDALVLIENFDQALLSMRTGFLAYGDAASASEKIQDTLARRLDKLNTAFVELGDTIANMGELSNLSGLKAIVSLFTEGIQGLTALAKGESIFGGVGQAAFQALPLAIIGGFTKFLGKRIFQNIRGTELRQMQEFVNFGGGGGALSRTQAATQYAFFGKQGFKRGSAEARALGTEIKNISRQAKLAGVSFGAAHKQMALMTVANKTAVGGLANLNTRFKLFNKISGRTAVGLRAFGAAIAPRRFLPRNRLQEVAPGGSVGLATARIGGALGGLLKGLAATGAIILAVEAIIKAVEYIKSIQPKTIDFDGIVDPASEASVAFKTLAETLKSVKKQAKDANQDLKEYVGNRSLADVAVDLQPVAEKAGQILFAGMFEGMDKEIPTFNADLFKQFIKKRKIEGINIPETDEGLERLYKSISNTLKNGAVNNRAQLKKYLIALGIDEKDIPTEEATKRFQKIFRDFLKFEIAGDLATESKEANKNLGELLDKLKEGFRDSKIEVEGFSAELKKVLTRPITGVANPFANVGLSKILQGLLGDVAGVTEADKVFAGFVAGFAKNAEAISKAFGEAGQDIEGKSVFEVFGIKDQESIATAIVKISDKWKEVSKTSDNLPPLHEILGEYLDRNLGTFSGGATLDPSLGDKSQITDAQKALEILRDVGRTRIEASLKETANQALSLIQAITGLERDVPNSFYAISDAALDAAYALLKIPDRIFNALSKYVADIEKVKISKALAPLLGVGVNPEQNVLDATRGLLTSITNIFPAVADNVRKQENVNERIKRIFEDDSKAAQAIANIVKLAESGQKKEAIAITDLELLLEKPEFKDIQGFKKTVGEAVRVIKDLFKVRGEEALLVADTDTAIRSWTNLRKVILDTIGIDIGSEVQIKEAAERAARGLDTSYISKIFEKPLDVMMSAASRAINDPRIRQLDTDTKKQISGMLDYAKRIRRTGDIAIDAQTSLMIDYIKNVDELNIEAEALRGQLKRLGTGDEADKKREEVQADLDLIGIKKKTIEQTYQLSSAFEEFAAQADRINDATQVARDAFKQLFADIKRFDTKTNDISFAFEDAFNQIANVRLERISEQFSNQLLSGFNALTGLQFGEFLLGEEIKDPLDLNTDALKDLTLTLDEVKMLLAARFGSVGGVTGEERFGSFEDVIGGESFADKAKRFEKGLEQIGNIFENGGKKIEFELNDILEGTGQILGGVLGGLTASGAGKQTNAVNIGTSLGGSIGKSLSNTDWAKTLGEFAGFFSPIGSILGGVFGGLFGRNKQQEEEKIENLRRIADNTAELVAVDRRIFNAPASFTLPAAVTTGGSLVWSGNIIVNSNGDATSIANEVVNVINRKFRSGTSNYNVVAGA